MKITDLASLSVNKLAVNSHLLLDSVDVDFGQGKRIGPGYKDYLGRC